MGNTYKEQYLKNKEQICTCLDHAIAFMDELGDESRKNSLMKQKKDLENGEFTIVVVGEFSAGKSTFLNALMGKKLLPSFTSETTATVNFLRHKDQSKNGEEGCVYFNDGSIQKIEHADGDTIAKFVSTKGDNVAENVHHLDLYMDSKFLENNVTLVDSPGLNGVAAGHAEITKEQIQKSSASIFMFNAKQPGSRTNFEVLADLSKRVSSIICVLNQIDAIRTNENDSVESVIKKIKNNYKDVMGEEVDSIPEIYPVSAYQALVGRDSTLSVQDSLGESYMPTAEERKKFEEKSLMSQFEDRLFRYLTQGEKAKAALSAPIQQMMKMVSDIKGELEEDKQILDGQIDAKELQEQIEILEEERQKLQDELSKKKKEIHICLNESKKEIIDSVIAESDKLKKKLIHRMEGWEEPEEIDPKYIQIQLERGILKITDDVEEEFRSSNGRIITDFTNEIIDDSFETNFKFKVSGELEPISAVEIGVEKHKKELERLEKEKKQLEEERDRLSDDYFAIEANVEAREELKNEIKNKKAELDNYVELSANAIPSVRVYTESEERKHTIKKRKIFADKVEYVMVDVTKTDSSERDDFIRERNSRISRKELEIQKLEEELNKMPTGNSKAVYQKQQQINAAIAEKLEEKKQLNENFRNKAKKSIDATLRNNKRMIEDYLDDNIDKLQKTITKHYEQNKNQLVNIISDHISANVNQKIEKATQRIAQMQENMKKAETEKMEKSTLVNDRISKAQNLLNDISDLYAIVDDTPVDVIDSISLED